MKTIYFDMDGTIADLYNVENWLPSLMAEDPTPYLAAAPMWNMEALSLILNELKKQGYKIGLITWLSKGATRQYKKAVRQAKRVWLKKHLKTEFDEMHLVAYGTPKHKIARDRNGIIFDDDSRVRAGWQGQAINPTETNIINFLEGLKTV